MWTACTGNNNEAVAVDCCNKFGMGRGRVVLRAVNVFEDTGCEGRFEAVLSNFVAVVRSFRRPNQVVKVYGKGDLRRDKTPVEIQDAKMDTVNHCL
jgi:hypothetical protein